jgi:hypothetical protein
MFLSKIAKKKPWKIPRPVGSQKKDRGFELPSVLCRFLIIVRSIKSLGQTRKFGFATTSFSNRSFLMFFGFGCRSFFHLDDETYP